ncbi:hypothetical protein ACFZDG_21740 [Kitasatospora xanthocidica]|uniref:hypothetical protein n=1 Tax=Kitasatospora xanthocidica TaxID=83382 RepID=UPI0036F0E3D1
MAKALVVLYDDLRLPSLEQAVILLAERDYGKKDSSELSRYFNGRRLPPRAFAVLLHDLATEACQLAGAPPPRISRSELLQLHSDAEPTLCKSCPGLRRERDGLWAEVEWLRELKSPPQAGLEAAKAVTGTAATQLPVPSMEGDRQLKADTVVAARELADRAEALNGEGDLVGVAALFQEVSEVLSPVESAAALVLLRQRQQDQLAENLIRIYVRDQLDRDVMKAALELHEYGYPDDAGAVLRAAAQ